jgi:prophage regulatory protein
MRRLAMQSSLLESHTMSESNNSDKSAPRKMLNEQQVLEIIPISSVTLWRLERAGTFPKGSFISPNRKIWYEDEIIAWQDEVNGRGRGRKNHRTDSKS